MPPLTKQEIYLGLYALGVISGLLVAWIAIEVAKRWPA